MAPEAVADRGDVAGGDGGLDDVTPWLASVMVKLSVKLPRKVGTNWAWIWVAETVYFMNPLVSFMLLPMRVTKSGASGSVGNMGRRPMPRVTAMTTMGPAPLV